MNMMLLGRVSSRIGARVLTSMDAYCSYATCSQLLKNADFTGVKSRKKPKSSSEDGLIHDDHMRSSFNFMTGTV